MTTPSRTRPPYGRRVRVYYDSTRRTWSVVLDRQVAYKSNLIRLSGCTFVVNDAIRERVKASGRKTPHAYVEGVLESPYSPLPTVRPVRFGYNPRTHPRFATGGLKLFLKAADTVAMSVLQGGATECLAYGAEFEERGYRWEHTTR